MFLLQFAPPWFRALSLCSRELHYILGRPWIGWPLGVDSLAGDYLRMMMFIRFSLVVGLAISLGGFCRAADVPIDHDPAKATSYLDVAGGLEVTLFCSEPRMTNPTNIDIDPQGRVWVCDVQNYRGHNGLRQAGDRILVMQDTAGNGRADRVTTFYQGRDVDSAMGVCVLGRSA